MKAGNFKMYTEENSLDYLADAFEFAVKEDVSIMPIVDVWAEKKDSISNEGSVDRFFELISKLKTGTGRGDFETFQVLWDKKEEIPDLLKMPKEARKLFKKANEIEEKTSSWLEHGKALRPGFIQVGQCGNILKRYFKKAITLLRSLAHGQILTDIPCKWHGPHVRGIRIFCHQACMDVLQTSRCRQKVWVML